jgi:hypothetical protein
MIRLIIVGPVYVSLPELVSQGHWKEYIAYKIVILYMSLQLTSLPAGFLLLSHIGDKEQMSSILWKEH